MGKITTHKRAGGECEAEDCGVCEVGLPEADVMDGMHDDGGDDEMYGMVQGEAVDIRRRARAIDSCPRPKGESGKFRLQDGRR